MSLTKRKLPVDRRLPTPDWAMNDSKLRDVLVRFMELRAGFKRPRSGTPEERLARANKRRLARKPHLTETIGKLAREYVAVKKAGDDPARLKLLAIEIESIDTQLRFLGNEDKMVVGVVYRYYRLREDSVATGAALAMRPPHVRQVLWRLDKAARAVACTVRISMHINMLRGIKFDPVAVPEKGQKTCWVCGVLFTPTHGRQKFCKPLCRRKAKAAADKKRPNRGGKRTPQRYFCSDTCKETGWNIKRTMLVLKPAVGQFVAPPGGDSYDSYAAYCKVVGAEPIPREAWSQGGLVSEFGIYAKK
jgi:hypothetical protein